MKTFFTSGISGIRFDQQSEKKLEFMAWGYGPSQHGSISNKDLKRMHTFLSHYLVDIKAKRTKRS